MTTTELWLTGDLAGILRGLALAVESTPAGEYRAGYFAALRAVAVSIGAIDHGEIIEDVPRPRVRRAEATGYEELGPGSYGAFIG